MATRNSQTLERLRAAQLEPRHRGDAFEWHPTAARCTCGTGSLAACPRHRPAEYAAYYARHATDSIMAGGAR